MSWAGIGSKPSTQIVNTEGYIYVIVVQEINQEKNIQEVRPPQDEAKVNRNILIVPVETPEYRYINVSRPNT